MRRDEKWGLPTLRTCDIKKSIYWLKPQEYELKAEIREHPEAGSLFIGTGAYTLF